MTYGVQLVRERGWSWSVKNALTDLGFTVVDKPANAAEWEEIKGILAAERPLQARLFDCVSVADPLNMTFVVSSWSQMLLEAGQTMIAAGLPRDEVVAEIGAADVDRLWTLPEEPDARAELLEQCEADMSWMERFARFQTDTIKIETMRIVGVAP